MIRLSRPCYDKPHRCPGWAGGGLKYAKVDRCADGHIKIPSRLEECVDVATGEFDDNPGAHPFRFGSCDTCNVITWPWATRLIDPSHWLSVTRHALTRLRWRLSDIRRSNR